MSLVSLSGLLARLGLDQDSMSDEDINRALGDLEDAEGLVLDIGGVEDVALLTERQSASLARIIYRVARRGFTNPDELSAETAGDYSYTRKGVGLGSDDLYQIRIALGSGRQSAFSINPTSSEFWL